MRNEVSLHGASMLVKSVEGGGGGGGGVKKANGHAASINLPAQFQKIIFIWNATASTTWPIEGLLWLRNKNIQLI